MNDSISEALITIFQESIENDPFTGMPSACRTPEHVKHAMAAINQEKLVIDATRIRRSGNSTDYCFRYFDRGSWHERCQQNLFCVPVIREEGNSSFTGFV